LNSHVVFSVRIQEFLWREKNFFDNEGRWSERCSETRNDGKSDRSFERIPLIQRNGMWN